MMARIGEGGCAKAHSTAVLQKAGFARVLWVSRAAFLCAVVLLLLHVPAAAQEVHIQPRTVPLTKTETPPDPKLKTHGNRSLSVDVDLVLVNVTVTDPMNRLVTGLEKEHFRVFEGNQAQQVRHFSSEDAPISLGVIFDLSGSMSNKIEKAREAVVQFFKTANPQDEFFMVTFADRPEVLAEFTRSVEDMQNKLVFTVPKGRTALLDAIYLGVNKMREAQYSKKALLIISDGGDNRSRYTEGEIEDLVKEADVQIYAIGIFDLFPTTPEERTGPSTLASISEVTGGRTFTINSPNDLADVATKIGIELRNQYVLGYKPTDVSRNGKWRKIKVKLVPPKGLPPLQVYAKSGYYAPSE